MSDFDIKNKIVSYLRTAETEASASEIAKQINHNRITVGKYLQVLEAQKIVTSKRIASGIYWKIAESHTKPKILIVDDEKHIVDMIHLSLSSGGYLLYDAFDGEEALKMTYNLIPDVLILDIMMPKKNGIEVCKEIKSNILTQGVYIIIVSAKGEIQDKIELMNLGADEYIVKPFDPLELEARVANIVRKKQAQLLKHPLTQLPNASVTDETREVWNRKKNKWYELRIHVTNYEEYAKQYGYKRASEITQLFVRMLQEETNISEFFVGHASDTTICIFNTKPLIHLRKNIESRFSQMLPFFYPEQEKIKKDSLSLQIEDITHA